MMPKRISESVRSQDELFPEQAEFNTRQSAGGKYVSITVKELMLSADEVIQRYQKALAIEGVIVL